MSLSVWLTTRICGGINTFGSKILPAACWFLMEKPIRLLASVPDALTDEEDRRPLARGIRGAVRNVIRGIALIPDAAADLAEKSILRRIPIPAIKPGDSQPDDLSVPDVVPKKAVNIVNSFSYGLILFGAGLIAVLLYLIFN